MDHPTKNWECCSRIQLFHMTSRLVMREKQDTWTDAQKELLLVNSRSESLFH